jgi:hypothetical protein
MLPNGCFQIEALSRLPARHRCGGGREFGSSNYHFGSKDRFIRAVIKRRVDSINARRLAALARADRQEGNAPVPTDKIDNSNWRLSKVSLYRVRC